MTKKQYAKLEKDKLIYAPNIVTYKGTQIVNPQPNILKELGYKQVVTKETKTCPQGYTLSIQYTEEENQIVISYIEVKIEEEEIPSVELTEQDKEDIIKEVSQTISAKTSFDMFSDNMHLDYAYDASTNANYTVLRIYKNKLDGSQQYPFIRYPTRMSALELSQQEDWFLICNSGLGTGDNQPIDGIVIENGEVIQNEPATYHRGSMPLTIDSNGDLGYAEADVLGNDLVKQGIVSAVCGFCPLIIDYKAVSSFPKVDNVSHFTANAQRQIIGQFGNGDYAIITCEGRGKDNSDGWTLAEAQTICKKLGLKFAYNLDGGGSTETVLGKKQLNTIYEGKLGRKVPTFIVFNGMTQFNKEHCVPTNKKFSTLYVYKEKTSYKTNDTFNTDDIRAIAYYTNGTSRNISNEITIDMSNLDMTTSGNYIILCSYTDNGTSKTQKITIQVTEDSQQQPTEPTITSVTFSKDKTNYEVGDTIEWNDLKATITYSDNTTSIVQCTYDASVVDNTQANTYNINVAYGKYSSIITIVVSEKENKPHDNVNPTNPTLHNLPEGYKELDYIETDGSQYITLSNLNEKYCNDDIEYIISLHQESSNGGHILSSKNLYAPFLKTDENGKRYIMARIANQETTANDDDYSASYQWEYDTPYHIKFYSTNEKRYVSINDNIVITFPIVDNSKQLQSGNYFTLFNYSKVDSKYGFIGRLYYCKIHDSKNHIYYEYIPCINPDGNIGIYDTHEQTFYTTSQGNSFIAGNILNS